MKRLNNDENSIYSKIWNFLNSNLLTERESKALPNNTLELSQKIDLEKLKTFCIEHSNYRIINLSTLSNQDKEFLESNNLSLAYLKSNKVTILPENITKDTDKSRKEVRREYQRITEATEFQLDSIKNNAVSVICPISGKILKSNRSFLTTFYSIFYRFESNEVFYLITGDAWFEKAAFYFPRLELIVLLFSKTTLNFKKNINALKTQLILNWQKIYSYLSHSEPPKKIVIIRSNHFAHHLWNELSAINNKLHETDCLKNIDLFCVINEPLGRIDEIFPEIPSHKIKLTTLKELEAEIIEDNYFVISLGDCFIKQNLIERIYQNSLNKCNSILKKEIQLARKTYFPIFWISIRLGSRTWKSQIEGLANIINTLFKKFPNFAIVIDGFSLPERRDGLINSEHQSIINAEKDVINQIVSLLSPQIKIYNNVGCWLHESIVWAHAVDFYLVHQGTIQHKIGWTANKPGIVHTNKRILRTSRKYRPGCWERENLVQPIYVSQEHISNIDEKVYIHNQWIENPKGAQNYECDWKGVYEEVLKLASSIGENKININSTINKRMNYLKDYFDNNQNRRIHKLIHYFDIYERHFNKFRNQEVHVLEIGINQGGSLQMWKDYFGDNAKIYGVDIDHRCKYFEEERIEVFIGSQADRSFLKSLTAKLPRIDILIDDGSHMPEHQIITFEELFPHVSENGIYLCEDLCSNYWERYGGAYKNSSTFIEYSKNFIDKLNAWHSEEPEKLDVDTFTRSAYSMHYYDSILVIDKLEIKKPYHKQTGYFSHNFRNPEAIEKAISSSQQTIEANKNSYSAYMMLGNALSEKGQQQDAITNYQKALDIKENPAIYYSLGNARLKQGDWSNAIANYQKALELNAQHPFCIVPCIVLRSLGTALNQQGDLDAAVDAYQEALKLEPNNANNYIGLAGIQFRMGKKQAAISSYQKAIELEPTNFRAYISLANIFKKEGQKDKAIALYEKAIELRPNLPKLHTELSQGYLDRAIEGYKRAIKLNPNISFDVYQNLATILKIQGKEDEAEKLIKSAPHPTKSNDS